MTDDLAAANLAWFRALPVDESTVAQCCSMSGGRFFMAMMNDQDADAAGGQGVRQVAEIQVLRPRDPVMVEAMSTTPPRADRHRRQEVAV